MMKRYFISLCITTICMLFFTSAYFHNDNAYTATSKSRKKALHRVSLAKNEEFKKNGPYIVHLKPGTHLESFQSALYSRHLLSTENRSKDESVIDFDTKLVKEILPNAVIVYGLKYDDILQMPDVLRITPNSILRIRAEETVPLSLPWGIDRINQDELPLDQKYYANYTGSNIDVYIVDTGIDTTHDEFAPQAGVTREVKNVYNDFATSKKHPATNTDDVGHGTHVAGTIGGRNVGVSPHANIYGLKILNSDGEGSVDAILLALNYVVQLVKASKKLSIVSMSLGGPCDDEKDCKSDALVMAVEKMSSLGIFTSVASGNEGCNACNGSPNAAPSAINVAASDQEDNLTYFSNFGQCIDIIAPGWDILSACSSLIQGCGNKQSYIKMSGTSMACPHATGVIAQVLEKFNEYYTLHGKSLTTDPITVNDVLQELSCRSSKNHVSLETHDSITKNLLLRTPKRVSSSATSVVDTSACQFEVGCPNSCSSNGFCMPQPPSAQTYHSNIGTTKVYSHTHSSSSISSSHVRRDAQPLISATAVTTSSFSSASNNLCYCENGFYGSNCVLTTDPSCSGTTHTTLQIDLYDSFGDGWSFSNFKIMDMNTGLIINNAMDSLCYGDSTAKKVCLPDGEYAFEVTRGYFPEENSWDMCGSSGGSPFTSQLHLKNGKCNIACNQQVDSLQALTLKDSGKDGWDGAYYTIFNEMTGINIYGGTMLNDGKEEKIHHLCLPKSTSTMVCSLFFIQLPSSANIGEISFSICDYSNGQPHDLIRICIDSLTNICTVKKINHPPSTDSAINSCQKQGNNNITFYLFDTALTGWSHNQIEILNEYNHDNSGSGSGSNSYHQLIKTDETIGFANEQSICIPDGCYSLNITHLIPTTTSSSSSSSSSSKKKGGNGFLDICNYLSGVPIQTRICVEQKYGLCYGLENCLNFVSYAKMSDFQYIFITKFSDTSGIDEIVYNEVAHGAHPLCALKADGCYDLIIGGGRYYDMDSSDDRNRAVVCGNQHVNLPFYGSLCISEKMTKCVVTEKENTKEPLTCRPVSRHLSHSDVTAADYVSEEATMDSTSIPIMIIMLDLYGDGWTGSMYEISVYNSSDTNDINGGDEVSGSPLTDDIFGGGADDNFFNDDGSGIGGGSDDYYGPSAITTAISSSSSSSSFSVNEEITTNEQDSSKLDKWLKQSIQSTNHHNNSASRSSGSNLHESSATTAIQPDVISMQLLSQIKDFEKTYKAKPVTATQNKSKSMQKSNSIRTTSAPPLFSGTLDNGQIGQNIHCLVINQCYTFSFIAKQHADEVLWSMCGLVGDASAKKVIFCVTEHGCEFQNIQSPSTSTNPKGNYYNTVDDDFYPQNHELDPTRSPVVKPTEVPTNPAITPTHIPVASPVDMPTYTPTLNHIILPPAMNFPHPSSSPTTNTTDTEAASTNAVDIAAATRVKVLMLALVFGILAIIVCFVIALVRYLKRNRTAGIGGNNNQQSIGFTTYNPLSRNDTNSGSNNNTNDNDNSNNTFEMTNISMKPTHIQPKSQKSSLTSSQQPSKSIFSSLLSQTRAKLRGDGRNNRGNNNTNKSSTNNGNNRMHVVGMEDGDDENLQLALSPQEREHTIHFQLNGHNDDNNDDKNYDEDVYDDYEKQEEEHDVLRSNKYTTTMNSGNNNNNTTTARNRRNSSIGLLSSISGVSRREKGGGRGDGTSIIDDEIIDMRV